METLSATKKRLQERIQQSQATLSEMVVSEQEMTAYEKELEAELLEVRHQIKQKKSVRVLWRHELLDLKAELAKTEV